MKNRKVTQHNLYLLLPGKVSKMAQMYSADFDVSIQDAFNRIYNSSTYRELENEDSKLWHYGPVALYEMFLANN